MKTNRSFIILLSSIILVCLTGCPRVELTHPIMTAKNTFKVDSKWRNKNIVSVQVLIKNKADNTNKEGFPGLFGPCRDIATINSKDYPFITLWEIRSVRPISGKEFSVIPGIIPNGFEQVIPPGSGLFTPVVGQEYFVMMCLEPVDENFYSIGVRWIP
jgi:hypothetical protein